MTFLSISTESIRSAVDLGTQRGESKPRWIQASKPENVDKIADYSSSAVSSEYKAMYSSKEHTVNPMSGMFLGMKVIGKQSLHKLKKDNMLKFSLVDQAFNKYI